MLKDSVPLTHSYKIEPDRKLQAGQPALVET